MSLSKRLLACCSMINAGERVADIGCDHGYLGIHLLQNRIATSIIAADINEGPLQSAVANAEKFSVSDKMEFYLSDGVAGIPRDFDVMVCAGMGGDTMISILQSAPWLKSARYRLVLQCQSKTPALRKYLSAQGWYIEEENVLRDGRFLYSVMSVLWQPEQPRLTAGECYFSPALLKMPSPEAAEYFRQIRNGLKLSAEHQKDPEKMQVLNELDALCNTEALAYLKEESL